MYCMNCGAENDDQSKFCMKCGQKLTSNVIVGKKQNSTKKKSRNLYMVSTALVLVAAITIVSVFDLWPWSLKTDKKEDDTQTQQEAAQEGEQAASNDGTVTLATLPLNEIVTQCPDCQAAIETYIATIEACQDWTTSMETIETLENQKCAQMQHFCTAQSIYVEDIPYAYHGSFGLYTGGWIGAGPSGKGSYIGAIYDTDIVSYTGDWGFGMPNGEGELYLENYQGEWDMTYTGQLKNGMRDGVGVWLEYWEGNELYEPVYRLLDEAVYSQDQLTDWTDSVKYNAETGEILQYCKQITDEEGMLLTGETWDPGDLSPEQEQALGIATAIAIFGFTSYLTYSALTVEDDYDSDAGNQRMLAEVNAWREQKETDEQEKLEREEQKEAQIRQANRDRCDELEAAGETDTWEYRNCYAYSYY